MIFGIYAIRDVKTGFMSPTVEQNDAVAQRNFSHAVQMSDSVLFSHPQDFSLYKLGEYDAGSGHISSYELIQQICTASDAISC